MKHKRIVITGIGVATPIGLTVNDFWQNLSHGVSGAGKITYFDTENLNVKIACELKNFNPLDHVDARTFRHVDMSTCYALAATDQAVSDANIDFNKIDQSRCGIVLGTGIGGISSVEREYSNSFINTKEKSIPDPFFITKIVPNTPTSFISLRYHIQGPSYAISSACSSSISAINNAYTLLDTGIVDMVIAGGTEAPITPWGIVNFDVMKALSRNNDNPAIASRPCDVNRNGFVMSEGAGILILETLEHAQKRSAKIYGEIIGIGMCSEAYHYTAPNPDGTGALMSMQNAIQNAQISPNDIDLISLHATSTQLGDAAEINAIKNIYKNTNKEKIINMVAMKSVLGHSLGASGAIELAGLLLSMQHNIIPATINTTNPIEDCSSENLKLIINDNKKTKINIALKNAFGFGGHNASIIIKSVT